jgi:hypothetical protein
MKIINLHCMFHKIYNIKQEKIYGGGEYYCKLTFSYFE